MSNTFLSQSDFKRTIHHTDKLRVAAYIRVSTDEDDQENSFEVQKAYFEETLRRNHHWTSAGVFSDYGISGTQRKNREGFNRMMRKCKEGKIDRILCKSISRLARNTADFMYTYNSLQNSEEGCYLCPQCGAAIEFDFQDFCSSCGQALGWDNYENVIVRKAGEQSCAEEEKFIDEVELDIETMLI